MLLFLQQLEPATELVNKYGFAGICIVGLASYILFMHRMFDKERSAHRKAMKELAEVTQEMARDGHRAIVHNTDVLSGLKTLLETTTRKR